MSQRWNDAWEKNRGVIHSEKEYDELLMTVSEWGYCVETPADFNFA